MEELLEIYHRNFPNNIRNEETVKKILSNPNNHIIEKRIEGNLIGVSIINKNTIIMLCVDKEYRKKGIGTKLLNQSEKFILDQDYDKVNVGAGYDYLMPGVPINETNISFFERRFYTHSWGKYDCFDLDMELKDFNHMESNVGDTINGVTYRWAIVEEIPKIVECADDACQYQDTKFSKYYVNEKLYQEDNDQRVIVAEKDNQIVGCIIVSFENEGKDIGSAGCTCVRYDQTHQKIGTNIVMVATRNLKDRGLKYGHIGYTYTGLDKLYGYSGYKVTTKYFMAEKPLVKINDADFNFRKIKKEEFDKLRHSFNDTDELWNKYKEMRMKQYDENDVDTYIVELKDKVVGEVTVNYSSHDLPTEAIPNQRVYVQAFRIEPSYQGYGLGQKLMDYALSDLENKGITEFTIGVEDDNEVAKHIYFKYGFTEEIDHGKGDEFDPTDYTLYMKTIEKENRLTR